MIKKFSAEGRFECGLDDVLAGKVFAFVAVLSEGRGEVYRLGAAIANEPGYMPIPLHWCNADTYAEMNAHADELNFAEGHDPTAAAIIVASTMRKIPGRNAA